MVAVRARFNCKLASSIKLASTSLCEACAKYTNFIDKEEPEFFERFRGAPAVVHADLSMPI